MDGIKPNNKSSNVANLKRGMQLHRLTERVKKKKTEEERWKPVFYFFMKAIRCLYEAF